jgi:hypothetical protein
MFASENTDAPAPCSRAILNGTRERIFRSYRFGAYNTFAQRTT